MEEGGGVLAGQFEFRKAIKKLSPGINNIRFIVPNISLTADLYSCSVVVFSNGGKKFLFSARDFFSFNVTSNNRFGVAYAIGSVCEE